MHYTYDWYAYALKIYGTWCARTWSHESLNDTLKRKISVQAHAGSWWVYSSEGRCCPSNFKVPTACPRLLEHARSKKPKLTWNTVESKEHTRESQSRWVVALGRPSDTKTGSSALFGSVCPKFCFSVGRGFESRLCGFCFYFGLV